MLHLFTHQSSQNLGSEQTTLTIFSYSLKVENRVKRKMHIKPIALVSCCILFSTFEAAKSYAFARTTRPIGTHAQGGCEKNA